jgi:hypothetical protein
MGAKFTEDGVEADNHHGGTRAPMGGYLDVHMTPIMGKTNKSSSSTILMVGNARVALDATKPLLLKP